MASLNLIRPYVKRCLSSSITRATSILTTGSPFPVDSQCRAFTSPPQEWRQKQLQDLERKLSGNNGATNGTDEDINAIQDDEELQPMWRAMESRVTKRRLRTSGPSGRANIKKTDEDFWLQGGLYDTDETSTGKDDK